MADFPSPTSLAGSLNSAVATGTAGLNSMNNPLGGIGGSQGTISQKGERLFTVRPRSGQAISANGFTNAGYVIDRGPTSTMKLLTGDISPTSNLGQLLTRNGTIERNLLIDSISELTSDTGFQSFFITDVQTSFNEKVQITEVFGDTEVAYYFGRSPIIFNISGLLFDDIDNNWFAKFLETYAGVLRGSVLAQNYQLIQLNLPNMQIVGSIMSMTYNQNSQRDTDIPFNIQILAKRVIPQAVNVPKYVKDSQTKLIDWTKIKELSGYPSLANINSLKTSITMPSINTGQQRATLGSFGGDGSTNAFINSLFSPIYGVLSSITKTIISGSGDISKIFSSFTSPINTILRDISSIATQSIALVQAIENGIGSVVRLGLNTESQLQSTLRTLKNAGGVITNAPQTISSMLQTLTGGGNLLIGSTTLSGGGTASSPSAVLSGGAKAVGVPAWLSGGTSGGNKYALLASGAPYSAASGAIISGNTTSLTPQGATL